MSNTDSQWRGKASRVPRYTLLVPHPSNQPHKQDQWITDHGGTYVLDSARPAKIFVCFYYDTDQTKAQILADGVRAGMLAVANTMYHKGPIEVIGFLVGLLEEPRQDHLDAETDLNTQNARWTRKAVEFFYSYNLATNGSPKI